MFSQLKINKNFLNIINVEIKSTQQAESTYSELALSRKLTTITHMCRLRQKSGKVGRRKPNMRETGSY